jgi:hypothetical protein
MNVTDAQIFEHIGPESYCKLQKIYPELYYQFSECYKESKRYGSVNMVLHEYGKDGREFKNEIIDSIATNRESHLVNKIRCDSRERHPTPECSDIINAIWFFIIFILVSFIAVAIIVLEIPQKFLAQLRCDMKCSLLH